MSELTQLTFQIGWIAMLLGGIVFFVMNRSVPASERHHGVVAMAIVFTAFANYLAMARGYGDVTIDGHQIFFARYVDWVITTPLLLLSLALVASRRATELAGLVGALVFADIYMIVTGLVGDLVGGVDKYIWWFISMVAFLAVLAIIWGPLRKLAENSPYGNAYTRLAGLLTVLWVVYPFVWLFGTSGMEVLSPGVEGVAYLILDVSAKVGFGFLVIGAARQARIA